MQENSEQSTQTGQANHESEQSSIGSGKQTNTSTQANNKPSNKQGMLGLGLVGVGLLAVLTNVGDESGFLWTGMISAIMFFAYYRTKAYGLLIPACILAGVTAGIIFELLSPVEGVFLLGLGSGFVAIDRIEQQKTRWPLYPGIILLAIGTVITVQTLFNNMLFALMLIVVGAYLLLKNKQVLDSMVDIKADIDIRVGDEAKKTVTAETDVDKLDATKTFASEDLEAKNVQLDAQSEAIVEENVVSGVVDEVADVEKKEAKTVVVDIMPEDKESSDAKTATETKVVEISDTDEVIEIEASNVDANVKDLDDAVSNIKKAVDKIVEDANLPKDDGQV